MELHDQAAPAVKIVAVIARVILRGQGVVAPLGFSLTPIERRFWLIHQLYPGHRWPILAGSSISKVPWTLGRYPQLFLSSLLRRCSARASSRRAWNPNWYSGPRLNFEIVASPSEADIDGAVRRHRAEAVRRIERSSLSRSSSSTS